MAARVEVTGDRAISITLKGFTPRVHAAVNAVIRTYAFKMARTAKQHAPVDEGRLRAAIRAVLGDLAAVVLTTSAVDYAAAVEKGSDPHTPPLRPLKEWGRRVLGSESAGAAVWHKIREEGTEAHPFMEPAFDEHADDFIKDLTRAVQGVIANT